uniref:Peptidase M16 N-terminal domain-containing protein n=1 Tax=Tetradesmus obliquus TaxID=3088 RepID=A0A383VRB5_TETOB|eukprot:jgi/Sobl393_1/709/SZX67389.1
MGSGTAVLQQPPGLSISEDVIKPRCDKLGYRVVKLPNELRVLLISDPETDKAAAALNVRVGSMCDPVELPGLAHFCEHMLFYSSEKYPVEDEYSRFISDHGGHTNAFTAAEDTNYQFDVNWDALPEALDRFAQFFISPLISGDGVEREVQAVDSEHGKNLAVDAWRLHQLCKATANQEHPWARFFTGNLETLLTAPTKAGIDVRAAVADWHARHYSANLMTAAVYGRQGLDELQQLAAEAFSGVANTGLAAPQFSEDLYTDEHRGLLVRVVPIKESHTLEIQWDIPPTEALYRQAPTNYLSHLLGHEGAGSAFALLKAAGLATSLTAGEGSGISSRSFFSVRLELTAEGNARPGEVAEVVFKYLELLRAPGGVNEQIYAELAGLSELRFHWRDKLPPYSVTTSLAGAMAHYPDRDLLLALYHVPQEFDPACIHLFLELLTPQRARLTWATRSHDTSQQQQQQKGDSTQTAASNGNGCGTSAAPAAAVLAAPELIQEPIYSTKHAVCRIPGQWMSAWTDGVALPGLHLPAANPFVPDDLSLRPEVGEKEGVPQLLLHGPSARVWQRTELRFGSPKATIVLDIQTPAAYASPESAVCVRLLVKLLGDYLNEVAYPAELAGLSYSLTNHLAGFQLSCQGYSEKLPVLLGLLLEELANFKVKPERFAVVKEAVAREYANTAYQQPYQWAMYRSELLLNFKRWRVDQYSQIIKALTPEALAAHMPRLLGRAFLEGLIVGNISPEEAHSIVDSALTKLRAAWGAAPLWPGEEKDLRVVKLPAGASSLLVEAGPNPKNENSAVWVTYQVGPDDLRRNALAGLLVQLAKRDAFNTLRTQQQLGYIVHMYGASDLGVQGISFIIQSDKYSAAHLALQVELFVRDTVKRIASLPEAEFEAGVAELAKAKLEKPKRLGELAGRWWGEIYAGTCMFDRQAAEVEVLRTLKPEDLTRFSEEVLGVERGVRRKAVVLIRGSNELQQQQQGEAAAATAAGQGSCAADGEQQSQAAAAAAAEAPGGATCPAAGDVGSKAVLKAAAGADDVLSYAASAVPAGEAFVLVDDINAFKRGCEVYAAPGAQPGSSSSKGKVLLGKGAAAAEAAAGGAAAAAANSEDVAPSKL